MRHFVNVADEQPEIMQLKVFKFFIKKEIESNNFLYSIVLGTQHKR